MGVSCSSSCIHTLRSAVREMERKRLHKSQAHLDPAGFYTVVLASGPFFYPNAEPANSRKLVALTVACHVGLVKEDKGTAYFTLSRITRSQVGVAANMPKLALGHWKQTCQPWRAYFYVMLSNRGMGSGRTVGIDLEVAAAAAKVTVFGLV